jgi:hypothetical protein
MALTENQAEQSRHLKKSSFSSSRRHHTDGNTLNKIQIQINHDSELDLTHHASLKTVATTDSPTKIPMDTG